MNLGCPLGETDSVSASCLTNTDAIFYVVSP